MPFNRVYRRSTLRLWLPRFPTDMVSASGPLPSLLVLWSLLVQGHHSTLGAGLWHRHTQGVQAIWGWNRIAAQLGSGPALRHNIHVSTVNDS
jgi:hypothetical protein